MWMFLIKYLDRGCLGNTGGVGSHLLGGGVSRGPRTPFLEKILPLSKILFSLR